MNFAKLKTRGIDVEVAYRQSLGNIGRLDSRLTWTHVLELTNFIDPTNPKFGDRILSEMGDPRTAFNWNSSLQHGRFTFGYQMRYIGKQINFSESFGFGEYEDFFDSKAAIRRTGLVREEVCESQILPRRSYGHRCRAQV